MAYGKRYYGYGRKRRTYRSRRTRPTKKIIVIK